MYTQSDIQFIKPPSSATGFKELTIEDYSPKDGQLTILAEKGARPHILRGGNFRIQVGKKFAGRHKIAKLTVMDKIVVQYGKEELSIPNGIYYVTLANGSADTPLIQ